LIIFSSLQLQFPFLDFKWGYNSNAHVPESGTIRSFP